MTMTDPDPRTAPDDSEDATNKGASSPQPAEGADDTPGHEDGSPEG
jgi:hypothetical protein